MRTFKWTTLAVVGIMALTSCNQTEVECPDNPLGRQTGEVQFKSTIDTRAVDAKWSQGDAIGVYALTGTQTVENAFKANAKYTTPSADGTFTAATDNDKISKGETDAYSYVAYYPYKADLTNNVYTIDLSNQTKMEAIDLLYSNNATGITATDVNLKFKHMLSQVRFNLSQGTDQSALTGLTVNVEKAIVDGTMPLATGVVAKGTTQKTVAANVQAQEKTAVVTVLLMPGQDLKDLTFVFKNAGKTYKQQVTESKVMESGKRYIYEVKMNLEGAEMTPVNIKNSTIDDWTTENGAPISLTPVDENAIAAVGATEIAMTSAAASEQFKFTAPATQAWTATVATDASWLTVTPTSGTGDGTLTINATENTTTAERTGTITITPTAATRADAQPLVVTVKQAGKEAGTDTNEPQLVFPGADFENWDTFLANLSKFGADKLVSQAVGEGHDGKNALKVNGTAGAKNGFLFTVESKDGTPSPLIGKSKVHFYMKGTASKAVSVNVYTTAREYGAFNLTSVTDQDLTESPADMNGYIGTIDTKGKWIKVTLDISSLTITENIDFNNLIAFKFGKTGQYDLLIDDITFE